MMPRSPAPFGREPSGTYSRIRMPTNCVGRSGRRTGAWSALVMSDTPDPSPNGNAATGEVLRGLAAVAPLPLVVLNGSHHFLYVNAAATELFGCDTDHLLGMDLIDYVNPGERSDVA